MGGAAGDVLKTQLKRWYDWNSQRPCLRCGKGQVQLHHIRLLLSPRTGDLLGRRQGINEYAVVPLCVYCHMEGEDSAHKVGDWPFFAAMGVSPEMVLRSWASWLAMFLAGHDPVLEVWG